MKHSLKWSRISLWLLVATVIVPALLSLSVGILILVFYRESWDVAFGVLVLCFAVFAIAGATLTVLLLGRASRLARLQAEFIARISHDFRTPLTAIRLLVDTLRAGKVADPTRHAECLEVLARETERMERLVEQALTWRHVQRASLQVAHSAVAPEELVADALAPLKLEARWSERILVAVEPALPAASVDAGAVIEALRNLVENALKHTEGTVVVGARAQSGGVAFSVRDQGPAIPRRERKRIFAGFHRLNPSKSSGSGLGLAIAREVARNHGGAIDLEVLGGNIFTLRLPAALAATAKVISPAMGPSGGLASVPAPEIGRASEGGGRPLAAAAEDASAADPAGNPAAPLESPLGSGGGGS